MKKYNPSIIEKKWQGVWEQKKLYETKNAVSGKKNYYLLTEFPYPSGNLHMGHWYTYAVSDILARYLRMQGKNVLYPIGFDAFGLPAENAAIQRNLQPADWTKKNITYMTKQLKSIGAVFDWSRTTNTADPEYYKWTQWIFLRLYEKGLAYRAKTLANWCPKDKTVLANEQVINGCCERCRIKVVQKEIEQWLFKICNYADRLIDDLEKVDWPEESKTAQRNWIGRSEGVVIKFRIRGADFIEVFTTRPDTIFGATYLVLAPEHEFVKRILNYKLKVMNHGEIKQYVDQTKQKTELERLTEQKEKTGMELKGIKAINPATQKEIPIWISDYVLAGYGTGTIMAVPAHDQRDFEFAKKYRLAIRKVIIPPKLTGDNLIESFAISPGAYGHRGTEVTPDVYTGEGALINSGKFSGMESEKAKEEIIKKLAEKKLAEKRIQYRLHDWIISRQRYWGVPIPMVNCTECGYQPVPEKDLPVKLPKLTNFMPDDDGRSPLTRVKKWVKTKCPTCGGMAERETDTMDTFVDSSWYFLRYPDPINKHAFADKKKMNAWLPVDIYVGGPEHITMHLLYARFIIKALYDLGQLDFDEPFLKRVNHGVILGSDSQKMSKSRGNVVDPDDLVKHYGADAIRMALAFMGPYDQGGTWQVSGIVGITRFLERIYSFFQQHREVTERITKESKNINQLLHKTIKMVGEDIENFHFNTAISELMKFLNEVEKLRLPVTGLQLPALLKLLAPFAPHFAQEIWQNMLEQKTSIHTRKWPQYDSKKIEHDMTQIVIQINGKARQVLTLPKNLSESRLRSYILQDKKIKEHIGSATIRRIVVVPNKLINLVI